MIRALLIVGGVVLVAACCSARLKAANDFDACVHHALFDGRMEQSERLFIADGCQDVYHIRLLKGI